ncbi:hypothetical protein ACWIGE_30200 [Streptomyces diastaticus]
MTTYGEIGELLPRRAESPSDGEREQSEDAFSRLLDGQQKAHHAALLAPVFTLGYVAGVRFGHTGLALAEVPLPPEDVAMALAPLIRHLEDIAPGDVVLYHGSVTHLHGRSRVHRVVTDQLGTRYDLEQRRDGFWVPSVWDVRRKSITPQN